MIPPATMSFPLSRTKRPNSGMSLKSSKATGRSVRTRTSPTSVSSSARAFSSMTSSVEESILFPIVSILQGVSCVPRRNVSLSPAAHASAAIQNRFALTAVPRRGGSPRAPRRSPRRGAAPPESSTPMHSPASAEARVAPNSRTFATVARSSPGKILTASPSRSEPDSILPATMRPASRS